MSWPPTGQMQSRGLRYHSGRCYRCEGRVPRGAETRRENDPSQEIVYEPKILSSLVEAWFFLMTVVESKLNVPIA